MNDGGERESLMKKTKQQHADGFKVLGSAEEEEERRKAGEPTHVTHACGIQ